MFHRSVLLAAIRKSGLLLGVLLPEYRADREVVLAAVKQEGCALRYTPPELQANRSFKASDNS